VKRIALCAALSVAFSALGQHGPCDEPPNDAQGRPSGTRTCYWDATKKQKETSTEYVAGNDVGPSRRFSEDGTLEMVEHFAPNLKEYKTSEFYYETGGIRRAEFESPNSRVSITFTVSGRIHKISCSPGVNGGYAYTVKECQPKVSFDLQSWRPAK
jgi:hypothetical protein